MKYSVYNDLGSEAAPGVRKAVAPPSQGEAERKARGRVGERSSKSLIRLAGKGEGCGEENGLTGTPSPKGRCA